MNNRLSRFIWILSPLLLYHVHNAASDSDTFVRFCQAPANYGKGKLEGTTKCTVTYSHKQTKDDTQAENFCTQGTPYRITSFTKGKPTICVYEKDYSCEAHEEDIGENCFLVHEKEGPFDPDACPDGYDLHVFEDRGELKWCTVIFEKHKAVWVGNRNEDAKVLRPQKQPKTKKRDTNDDWKPIFVRLNMHARDGTKRGGAYYGDKNWHFPYLCSRKASPFHETLEKDNQFNKDIGQDIYTLKTKDGKTRTYYFLHTFFPVELESELEPNFTNLHRACDAVDGHVATREDFDTEEAYKDVLKKYGPWFMRTPVGRAPSFTAKALPNCQKDPDFKKHRKFWSYYDRDGSSMKIPDNVWHDQNPTNMCADMRRTTAVMHKDGYVDVPPFLRRPVICVSGGKKSTRETYKQEENCNRAAHYNKKTKRCECNNPDADGVKVDPQKYKNYPEGVMCLDCDTTVEGRSIVFVMDSSGTVQDSGWEKQIGFMNTIASNIKNARTGIVKMLEPPVVSLEMGQHSKEELSKWVEKNKVYNDSWTLTGYAIHLATTMLEKEKSKHKTIMIFSDGDEDACTADYECYNLNKLIEKHTQMGEAEKAKKAGIHIIYVGVGYLVDPSHHEFSANNVASAKQIASGEKNYIEVGTFDKLDSSILDQVVKTLCSEIN